MASTLELDGASGSGQGARIRVVHLVSSLNVGGLERVVLDLARLTDRSRFEVSVLCVGEVGALGPAFEAIGVSAKSLGLLGKKKRTAVARLARILRRGKFDILHTHNPNPHLIGAVAGRLARVPVVVHTKHGRNYPHVPRKVMANRLAAWFTDRIVPVSADAADVLREVEKIPARKIELIRNGIDLEGFHPVARRPEDDRLRVIHVARLILPTKDQPTLLRAARIVADREPRFQLDLVGDGPHRAEIESLSRELRLDAHVRFLGTRHDVHGLLGEADLFVLSSVKEGLSITLLEAGACGLPIVATDVGGNSEVVRHGETGLLVPPGSPEAMADAMLELLHDLPRARAMGQAGRRRVEQEFDVRGVAARYEALYLSLLGQKQGRAAAAL